MNRTSQSFIKDKAPTKIILSKQTEPPNFPSPDKKCRGKMSKAVYDGLNSPPRFESIMPIR